ncbi:MAG: hypothetical protein WDM91_13865 [Rhizomicrobium sp.]
MRSRLFLAVFPLFLALAAPALARGTLDSILPGIRAGHPGRLSDAEPWTDSDGGVHYRIKWLTPEGRVLYFDADARTGRYSNAGGDNGGAWRSGRRGRDEDGQSDNDRGRRSRWNDDGRDSDWRRDGQDNDNDNDNNRGGWHRGGGDWPGRDSGRGGGRGGLGGGWHGGGRSGGHHHGGN